MMTTKKHRESVSNLLRFVLGLAITIPVMAFLIAFLRFVLATGVGSEQDLKEAMFTGGATFVLIGLIVFSLVLGCLRRGWRIGFSLPCICLIFFGLTGMIGLGA